MNESVIYFLQRGDGNVKVGTTTNLGNRLSQLRMEHGDLSLLGFIRGGRIKEKILHWCLESSRVENEWFKPSAELLRLIDEYGETIETKSPGRPKEFMSEPKSMTTLFEVADHAWIERTAAELKISRGEVVRRAIQYYRLRLREQVQ